MDKKVISDKWLREIGRGKKSKGLAACIESVIRRKSNIEWNPETTETYTKIYEEKILPLVEVANTKPISSYTVDDIENICYKIRILVNPINDQPYDSVDVYLRLLRFAFEEGIIQGWCDETILFGTSLYHETKKTNYGKDHKSGRLRKSLTAKEELTVFRHLIKSFNAAGEIIGLLLMLVFGLRNNETCPLTWNKIQPLNSNPHIHVLYIVETSKRKKKESKDTGKTKNFPRIIPIPKCIYEFLMKRKDWIRTYIQSNYEDVSAHDPKLKELGLEKYIGQLRIVCHGNNIFSKTRPDDLSIIGKKVLSETIDFDSRSYYLLNEYLRLPENRNSLRDFRDPTSYLFRRNFASFLLASLASLSVIQYLMGHVIEDPTIKRYDFSNSDKQALLYQLMERRPLFSFNKQKESIRCHAPYTGKKISGKQEYEIARTPGKEIEIEIQAFEPNDTIEIALSCNSEIAITKRVFKTDFRNTELVDNMDKQYRAFTNAEDQLSSDSNK